MSDHPRLLDIVRPILVSLVALAVVACAMAVKGWHAGTIALGGILVLLSALLLIQVHKAVSHLHSRSSTIEQAACEAERHYISVLRRIVALSDARDRYFDGHSLRVGKMASQLSRRLGLDERWAEAEATTWACWPSPTALEPAGQGGQGRLQHHQAALRHRL